MQSGRPMVTRTANGHRELALNALQPYRSSLFWNWWYEDIYVGTPTQTRLHHHQQSTVRQRPLVSKVYAGQTSRYKLYFSSFPFSSQCSCRTIIYSCNIHGDTIICSLWQSTFKLLLARTQILFSLSQTR